MWYTVCRIGEPRLCTAAVQSRDAALLSHGGLSVAKLRTRAAGELQELQEGSGRGPRRHAAAGGGRRRPPAAAQPAQARSALGVCLKCLSV